MPTVTGIKVNEEQMMLGECQSSCKGLIRLYTMCVTYMSDSPC